VPCQAIVDKWNSVVIDLPKVKALTEGRKKAIKFIWTISPSLDEFESVFRAVQDSDFLCGRTDKPWIGCGFDWVMKAANWTKIVEGNYSKKPSESSKYKVIRE
jgi:hypothetical protein